MSGKNTNDQRYVDVYDSVIKLVAEAKEFLESDYGQNMIDQIPPFYVIRDLKTVKVKTHRNSGMTTTAVRLMRKNDNNILLVPTDKHKYYIIKNFRLSDLDSERIIPISIIDNHSNLLHFLRGRNLTPELVIVDGASILEENNIRYNCDRIRTLKDMLSHSNNKIYEFERILNSFEYDWREYYIYRILTYLDCKNSIIVELG